MSAPSSSSPDERDLLRTLLENCPDQIYFKDLDSRFIKCSQALADRFKASHTDDLLGKTDFDFFTADHARPAYEDEQEIIRTGRSVVNKVERELWKDDRGKVTWVLTTKVPLRARTGAIIGTFGISKDITAIKEAESELESVHRQLLTTSRQAGMAEVATSVLHNIGNVLNSVNVSCSVIAEKVQKSRASSVGKTADLLQTHSDDLGAFLTSDDIGRKLPDFMRKLAQRLSDEQVSILQELQSLSQNIEHIKDIVQMQQSYAKVGGFRETVPIVDLVEDALRMNADTLRNHRVEVVREFHAVPPISVEKHKVLQILVNLVRNAKQAIDAADADDRLMRIGITARDGYLCVHVTDNGVGIPPENLTRIFAHGFTTKKDGHGFGLHSGVLAAQEMGGNLTVTSPGLGQGATFTLELPMETACRSNHG